MAVAFSELSIGSKLFWSKMNSRVKDSIKEFDEDGLVLLMTVRNQWSEEIWGYLEKQFLKNMDNLSDKILLRGLRSLIKS
jgi:hypothetical protein